MLAVMLTAAAAAYTPPTEPLKGQLQAAIWADLEMNALIGNGNRLASLWYNAEAEVSPNLHIADLRCGRGRAGKRCSFVLLRDGGPSTVMGQAAPDKLACVASFANRRDSWSVVHTRPRRYGHSQTTMSCKA